MTRRTIAAAMAITAVAACAVNEHEDGITVSVEVEHHGVAQQPLPAGEPREVVNDLGLTVTVRRAYVALGAVELVACPDKPSGEEEGGRPPTGPSIAHSVTTPTRLGVPFVDDLLAADSVPFLVGVIGPPPGRYCAARVTFDFADDDAVGLPDDIDVVGYSLYVEADWGSETIIGTCSESDLVEVPLLDEQGREGALVLDGDAARVASVVFSLHYASMFDGIDLAQGFGPSVTGCAILGNLVGALHVDPGG